MALPVSVLRFGERLTPVKVICAAVSVAGVIVAVLVAPSSGSGTSSSTIGYLWALLALVFWVAYLLVSKGVRPHVETVRFMFVVSLIGAATVSLLVVIGSNDLGEVHGAGWVWVALLALGPGIAGHGLVAWAQPRVDASVTSVLIQLEPVGCVDGGLGDPRRARVAGPRRSRWSGSLRPCACSRITSRETVVWRSSTPSADRATTNLGTKGDGRDGRFVP